METTKENAKILEQAVNAFMLALKPLADTEEDHARIVLGAISSIVFSGVMQCQTEREAREHVNECAKNLRDIGFQAAHEYFAKLAGEANPSQRGETYLGDGLYASFDGFGVKLRAPREDGDHEVYLEPDVFEALRQFRTAAFERAQAEQEGKANES